MFVVHYSFIWKHNCNNVCRISPNMPRLARMIWQTINVITSTLMGTDLYPHMPILLRAIYCNGVRGPRAGRFVRFGASGGAKFTKRDISCLGRRWTAVQNLTPLASSSAEKSVTVQTKNTQTITDISTPCLSACVDNNLKNIRNYYCAVLERCASEMTTDYGRWTTGHADEVLNINRQQAAASSTHQFVRWQVVLDCSTYHLELSVAIN